LAKDSTKTGQLNRVLATLADSLRFLGIILDPFLPDAAAKIRSTVGDERRPALSNAAVGRINTIPRVQKLSGLFPRVLVQAGDQVTVRDVARVVTVPGRSGGKAVSSISENSEPVGPATKDQFSRIELRVAEVMAAEAVPKSKKLLKLTVSLGSEQRTVVAGIAEHYRPADLVGKKVVIVANLEPARLMGIESQGMVLAASTAEGLSILTLDRDLPPGAKVT
jgi:methionyl-tRNA synthetase